MVERVTMKKYQIDITPDLCSGCLRCQLACSDLYQKVFNPSAARIQVSLAGADCTIEFLEDCQGCGICADQCFYGALQKQEKEAVA